MNMDPVRGVPPPNNVLDDVSEDSEEEDLVDDIDDVPDNPEKRVIGEYLLYLRSSTRATYDDVRKILLKMQDVVQWYVNRCLNDVQTRLQEEHDIQLGQLIDIEEIRNNVNCSQGLHTIHNQDVYFEKKFKVIKPERIELGERFVTRGTAPVGGIQPIGQKRDEFIHIPISKVLRKWLECGTFGNVSHPRTRREDNIMESFMDGTHIQNHPYRNLRPNCRLIKLYYDEADMCDAVGSKSSSINKMGMFYWMDEDIDPEHKSQLKFINLAGIVSHPHVNTYGMNKILEHIVKDVQKVENGIQLSNGETVYGTVSVLIGDNLAVHQLCGFRESFVARHPCRVCKASLAQVRTMCVENENLLRNPDEHDRQVREIETAEGNRQEELRTNYGINRNTVLNSIQGFHSVLSTPPDQLHDDFLGFGTRTTKLFLRQIIYAAPLITLKELNGRISDYDYGYSEKSAKPSPITENQIMDRNEGFKQNGAQMQQLITMLPLIISDKVPQGFPALENYLKMIEIVLISHADRIDRIMLDYLNSCITEYLETFQTIYNEHLTPKQHSLVHRVFNMLRHGPLGQYKTMRPEAFHQVSKRIAQSLRTYKNLALTLARKHQLRQAYDLRGDFGREITKGPLKWVPIDLINFRALFPNVRRLRLANWVQINGIKYVPIKCYLVRGYSAQNLPEFVALQAIVWRDEAPLFVCQTVETIKHNTIVMAYEVEINEEYVCLEINDLFVFDVYHGHYWSDQHFIIIKKALGNLH